MGSRNRRNRNEIVTSIMKETGLSKKQVKKKYVTHPRDMSFLDEF